MTEVVNKYRLYINEQLVRDYASESGVWARIGAAPFGSRYYVAGLNGADASDFVPF